MKKALFRLQMFVLVLLLSLPTMFLCAAEPVIHVIVASDGRAGFGANLVADYNNIERLFKGNIPKDRLNLVAMKMEEITLDKILQTVKEIELTEKDTLVFYYSGHAASNAGSGNVGNGNAGNNNAGNGGQYFQLKDKQGKSVELYRRTLLAALHEKNPRLTVLLTDCCNIEETAIDTVEKSAQSIQSIVSPEIMSPIMEALFIKPAGTVDITSSKRGEASFVDATEKKRGSCFTWPLVALFDKHRNNPAITWQEFTTELAEDVKKAFLDSHPEGFKFRNAFFTS